MQLLIDSDSLCYAALYSAKSDFLLAIDYAENSIYRILNRFPELDYDLYLTGKGNFRYKVADYYKANRTQPKPRFLTELKDYLVIHWGAIEVEGIEADDALGLRAEGNILVSIDKDLDTIGNCTRYNYKKDQLYEVSEREAALNFWVQMLTGDSTDNVAGIKNPAKAHHKNPPNFSEATARELLEEADQYCREVVEDMYQRQFGPDWVQQFDTHATLLFIQRNNELTYKDCNILYPKHVE